MGLPRKTERPSREPKMEPPTEAWFDFASEEARKLNCRPADVLGPSKRRRHVVARWRAWHALKQAYPYCSVAGIARVTGYDHTTIRYGIRRLLKEPLGFDPKWFPRMGPKPRAESMEAHS